VSPILTCSSVGGLRSTQAQANPRRRCTSARREIRHLQPGNPRLIEYNTKTTALRIRSSRIIAGQQIDYTANGPVLKPIEVEESESEPEATTSAAKEQEATQSAPPKASSDSELTDMESDQ